MSNTTSIRRTASIVGAAGLIALSMAGPASARPDPGTGQLPRCTTACFEGPVSSGSDIPIPSVDTGGVELVQLGGGLLAGVALAGAGMAFASRRTHGHGGHAAHPA